MVVGGSYTHSTLAITNLFILDIRDRWLVGAARSPPPNCPWTGQKYK